MQESNYSENIISKLCPEKLSCFQSKYFLGGTKRASPIAVKKVSLYSLVKPKFAIIGYL